MCKAYLWKSGLNLPNFEFSFFNSLDFYKHVASSSQNIKIFLNFSIFIFGLLSNLVTYSCGWSLICLHDEFEKKTSITIKFNYYKSLFETSFNFPLTKSNSIEAWYVLLMSIWWSHGYFIFNLSLTITMLLLSKLQPWK